MAKFNKYPTEKQKIHNRQKNDPAPLSEVPTPTEIKQIINNFGNRKSSSQENMNLKIKSPP